MFFYSFLIVRSHTYCRTNASYPYSKMCSFCSFVRFCSLNEKIPSHKRWNFLISTQQNLFGAPRELRSHGERKNDGALKVSEQRRDFRLAKSILTRGILNVILGLFGRVFCFGRVRIGLGRFVRLLERAEESCEGLKHGYYYSPCIYFLILCHNDERRQARCLVSPLSRWMGHRR